VVLPAPYPKNVDFLDLWAEKMFLGQEFLTWLWLTAENDSVFNGPGGAETIIRFDKRLVLQKGDGQGRSQIVCQNPDHDWSEAYTALGVGKKVIKAHLNLSTPSFECSFALPADTLAPMSVKLEREFNPVEEEGPKSRLGTFLNKVALMTALNAALDFLFQTFLTLRLSPAWTEEELPKLKEFLESHLLSGVRV
jgi:recombination associated protein RdgC